MQRYNIYTRMFTLLAVGMLLISCGDEFLEEIPDGTVTEEEFLARGPEDLEEIVLSSYEAMGFGGFMGGGTWLYAELMADNIDRRSAEGNQEWLAHYTRTTDNFLGTTRGLMADGGKVIGRANYALGRIDDFTNEFDGNRANTMRGECLFLRAVGHFELVRMFGQPFGFTPDNSHMGIPVHLAYSPDPVDRASVQAVYAQVIADLQQAAQLLPETNDASRVPDSITPYASFATSWSAKGYLAKVYFQMNDFQNAYQMANDVISNGPFTFDQDLNARFSPEGTPEAVFSLISTNIDADNSGGTLRGHYREQGGVAAVALSQFIYQEATRDTSDKRGQSWYNNTGEFILSTKFKDDMMQVPLVHLTELKLIRAESIAEGGGGDLSTAVGDLNDIRQRAGLDPISTTASADRVRTESREERRLELVGEGNRLHELKRQAVLNNPTLRIRGSIWSCNGLVCQIPDNELAGNPNMEPNPQGGCE
ncbi:MAG: RagB/SusD family nutrient uptake outer membrane protein [Bacteroidota bacterium]